MTTPIQKADDEFKATLDSANDLAAIKEALSHEIDRLRQCIADAPSGEPQAGSQSTKALDLRREVQDLWVAGTVGALFGVLSTKLPTAFIEFSMNPDWRYTADRVLRFGSVVWFLFYFFTANVINKRSEAVSWEDLTFDLLQSAGALLLLIGAGFADDNVQLELRWFLVLFSVVILLIAYLSGKWFGSERKEANSHRKWGGIIALLLGLIWLIPAPKFFSSGAWLDDVRLWVGVAALVVLAVILVGYMAMRLEIRGWWNGIAPSLFGAPVERTANERA